MRKQQQVPPGFDDPKWEAIKHSGRRRGFVAVGYLDSLAPDWVEQLESLHMQAVVSPLHDSDVNADGSAKKPHHHIMLMFDAPQAPSYALSLFLQMGAVVSPDVRNFGVNSTRAMLRYFCHLDNAEKHQYSAKDVKCFGGIDYEELVAAKNDEKRIQQDIMDFVLDNPNVDNWYDFLVWSRQYQIEWYEFASTHTLQPVQNALYWRTKSKQASIRKTYWERCGIDPEVAEALGFKPAPAFATAANDNVYEHDNQGVENHE